MDPGYLARLESAPAPGVSEWGVFRLAAALGTTVEALRGAPTEGSRGVGTLEPLDVDACWARIGDGGLGRVVVGGPDGPAAFPVSFSAARRTIQFRTAAGGTISEGIAAGAGRASLEVDFVDEAAGEGWSVIVTGIAHVRAPAAGAGGGGAVAHVAGHEELEVELRPDAVTGRRIRRLRDAR